MIARLYGTIERLAVGEVLCSVSGVGYLVSVPVDVWEQMEENSKKSLWISTYVREDRLDLYGFLDKASRTLFELLIAQSGIGPKMGLELCAVPRALLLQAVDQQDTKLLSTVKGVGKKKAEKLLLELKGLIEKQPEVFGPAAAAGSAKEAYDQDAIAALTALGYDTATILNILKELPKDLETTEQRVKEALRTL